MSNSDAERPADLPPTNRHVWALGCIMSILGLVGWLFLLRDNVQWILGPSVDDTAVAAARTAVALAVTGTLVVVVLHAHWRWRLELLAYRPGPLLVHSITDHTASTSTAGEQPGASATVGSSLAEDVRALLQRRLIETRLHGSTAIPSPGRASDFVQVADEASVRVDGLASALLRLPRVLSPRSSYEVRCSILSPEGLEHSDKCILLVELTRAPKHVLPPQRFTGENWDKVVTQAANWVCAMVLPRTRKCQLAPWTTWRGLYLKPDLFSAYQSFQAQLSIAEREPDPVQQRKLYDEALRMLDSAMDLDPLNFALRVEKGKLFEQTGRYLEALEIYDRILAQAARSDRRLAYLRFGPPCNGPSRNWSDSRRVKGIPSTDPTIVVARYRFALLLCLGNELAKAWWYPKDAITEERDADPGSPPVPPDDVPPDDVRRSLLGRMRSAYADPIDRMTAQFEELGNDLALDTFLSADVHKPLAEEDREGRCRAARLFFTSMGMWEVEHLLTEQSGWQPGARARWAVVPRRSVEMLLPRAILLRALAIKAIASDPKYVKNAAHSMLFPIEECVLEPELGEILNNGWPQDVDDLEIWIENRFGRRTKIRSWHEHYNAACVLSVLLQNEDVTALERKRIADAAVNELEKAVACGSSTYLASQGTWILAHDPDLAQLRREENFEDFKITILGRNPRR